MSATGTKPVSLEYKRKLLADIAYYEKRIEEAQLKRKHSSFEDESSSDEESNPYTVNLGPLPAELRKEEARLSNCTSMTLELAMLTIMQSEVNVMVTPPKVRRPVEDEGTWLEVAAECKIDLVSFTITFYAHKPHRRFAPTRYRNIEVTLAKPAHERELAQSVLSKLGRPNLALQVLQSYATAFRSRRTTLLDLAESYADRLKMEAMDEGGYRIKFLDLLTVEWTLENMWSPIVPFCHRMKFEVEYMPKHYIHAIGKLYKQFKDPSLQTSERTNVLAQIFDTCLEAQGPARDLQDTFESDPETAGRLHERRTTIDQEPEAPPNCDQHMKDTAQKLPKGKENKAQNSKTTMAPPKSLPKKAKKMAHSKKSKPNDENNDNESNVSKSSKTNDNTDKDNDTIDKTKRNDNNDAAESRKGVKRANENDANSNTKKLKTDDKSGAKPKKVVGDNHGDSNGPNASSKSDAHKKASHTAHSKNMGDKDTNTQFTKDTSKKNADAVKSGVITKKLKDKGDVANLKNLAKNDGTSKPITNTKETEGSIPSSKSEAREKCDVESVTSKTSIKKGATKNYADNVASAKDLDAEFGASSSKPKGKERSDVESVASSKTSAKKGATKSDANNVASAKDLDVEGSVASSKTKDKERSNVGSVASSKTSVKKGATKNNAKNDNDKDQGVKAGLASSENSNNNVKGGESVNGGSPKDTSKKVTNDKNKAPSKILKEKASSATTSNIKKIVEKDLNNDNNKDKTTKTVNKTKVSTGKIEKTDSNKTEKPKDGLEAPVKNKIAKQKDSNEVSEKSAKSKVSSDKVVTKNNNDKNKGLVQNDTLKNKVANTNTVDENTGQNNKVLGEKNINTKTLKDSTEINHKNAESLPQKTTKPNFERTKNMNNNVDKKNTGTIVGKSKNFVPKINNIQENKNDGTTTNRNETVEKVVENNKATAKTNTTKNQNKAKPIDKLQNINPKANIQKITTNPNIVKANANTVKPTLQKIKENQTKIAEKLKTRIPMMKNKLKIGALNDKLEAKNVSRLSNDIAKTKMPLKSLPVFKKVVRNVPARMSPRRLPLTSKPSSQGFSNK